MRTDASNLIAVDIGNSRIKIGRFDRAQAAANAAQKAPQAPVQLPEPLSTFELAITNHAGQFDTTQLRAWCDDNIHGPVDWLSASVHRGAAELLSTTLREIAKTLQHEWFVRQLNYRDVPLAIDGRGPDERVRDSPAERIGYPSVAQCTAHASDVLRHEHGERSDAHEALSVLRRGGNTTGRSSFGG